jgi:hypothetical protein
MAGVWEPVEKLESRLDAAEQLIHDLRSLQREISKGSLNQMTSEQMASHISSRLKEITESGKGK